MPPIPNLPSPAKPEPAQKPRAQFTLTWVGRPRPESQSFFGRDEDLAKIDAAIQQGHSFVISGGAGSGKSRLASEWSEQSGRPGLWSNGRESASSTLAGTAEVLGIEAGGKTDDEIASEVVEKYLACGILEMLEVAVDQGFINYPFLAKYDDFLEPVRHDPRGQVLLARVRREWETFDA